MEVIKIAIVDDHQLFANSLAQLIETFDDCEVSLIARNGKEFQHKLDGCPIIPDVILLDVNMPVMNGPDTLKWIKGQNINTKVLALSMDDSEDTVLSMLRHGAKGYLLKDIHPDMLQKALREVIENGFFHTEEVSKILIDSLTKEEDEVNIKLKPKELEFLKLVCTEMTYKEIAETMAMSPKTIDGYRESLFSKYGIKNRVGLVLFVIKNKIFEL